MPDIALDLRFLRYAILVARLGSFSAAAESLDLSYTTVNRRVSLLGRRRCFQLFERDATGATSPLPEPGSWRMPSAE
ncbi:MULTISPECIES: LysR family transcriptional regulator [Paracoccus]|uniref:helix-turn-helix domain-containing protein n=1 Tax=Paracoccus TaxID=265 RepID=UPI001FB576B8|nr:MULTISPECIES: LysR family transcriptional regulator [Paracoccus]MCJ1902808.1 LysR family transcriptional regulator [Paracoccus versutus]MDF3907361.1 LysR family transcriptional regulator [Paracoccus sp. AS002]